MSCREHRLVEALGDYESVLTIVDIEAVDNPPTLSWVDKVRNRMRISVDARLIENPEWLRAAVRHEIAHISLGHVGKEFVCLFPDEEGHILTAADVEVMAHQYRDIPILTEAMLALKRTDPMVFDPVAFCDYLKAEDPTFDTVHRKLDELRSNLEREEQSFATGMCGGVKGKASAKDRILSMLTADAIMAAIERGDLPANIVPVPSRGSDDFVLPMGRHIPAWANELYRWLYDHYLETVQDDVYTIRRPRRVPKRHGIILPSMKFRVTERQTGTLAVAVDLSGSMEDHLERVTELANVIDRLLQEGATVHLVYGDTDVVGNVVLGHGDKAPRGFSGVGGGTEISPLFDALREGREGASAIAVLTDGELYPPEDPGVPVLWIAPDHFEPPYGTVVPWR
jgi:hypothetical protein